MGAREEINAMVKSAQMNSRQNDGGEYFSFGHEAEKILKPFRNRVGRAASLPLARQFYDQYVQMNKNPDMYDERAKRQMLSQWKNRMDRFAGRLSAKDRSVSMTDNRQAVVAPPARSSLGTGWTGRQVAQGGSAPVERVNKSEIKPYNALHMFKDPKQIAQLPSMQMQSRMNAEGAAYDEILKRLNARGGDPRMNMQNARRLAPVVAKNYRRQEDGSWKVVSQSGKAQAMNVARNLAPPMARPAMQSAQIAGQAAGRSFATGRKPNVRMRSLPTGSLGGWSNRL